ncbi:ATP-dependent helicase [Herbaspirillum huttiense]|uniref:ATP-dependent helicase n=1 Tax=Herbaspirillum huttiense TaxID=863372 RepID=UPI0031D17F03
MMPLQICRQRQSILDANGPVLVTGGPGSGKTTIALAKAQLEIEKGLKTGQSVLFLSFSRAAVARVIEASKTQLPASLQGRLSIQTFHSFFWQIIKSYGYLLGAPRSLMLLMPHDEAAMRSEFDRIGADWHAEQERMFHQEGRVAFDLFASKAHALLSESPRIRDLFSHCHPLIVVDEAQDTAEDQWQCVRLLSAGSQMICLADLEQQIYDFRPGVSAERVTHIMAALQPHRVDLAAENHRSPNSEIVKFAHDILLATPRGAPYQGVSKHGFRPNREFRDRAIRQSIGIAIQRAEKETKEAIRSIAFLATWGRGVDVISRALNSGGKQINHRLMIDEAPVLLASRMISFLLEPRCPAASALTELAICLDSAAAVFRARGGKGNLETASRLSISAEQSRAGCLPRAKGIAAKLMTLLNSLREHRFQGDPKNDWPETIHLLANSGAAPLVAIAKDAAALSSFQCGKHIASSLTELWQTQGSYQYARKTLDAAISEDYLLSGSNDLNGLHVMTVHKAKGKEFDVVILFDDPNSSPFLFTQEKEPYARSRKLLRVGATRARHHALLLCDLYTPTPLLKGHVL